MLIVPVIYYEYIIVDLITGQSEHIYKTNRIAQTLSMWTDTEKHLRQRVGAREDSGGGLEAGEAVVPVYSKELLQFLAGVKIVRFFIN